MPAVHLHAAIDHTRAPRHFEPSVQHRLLEVALNTMPMQTLRRTGLRPSVFNGTLIATICGVTPDLPFWYELNVWGTVIETFVSDVRLFHNADTADVFRVAEHDDLDEAISYFEAYDPSGDFVSTSGLAETPNAALLALKVARLELEIATITQHYRSLVGQLLTALSPK